MRRFLFSACIAAVAATAVCSCNGKSAQGQNGADSLVFDSVKVDSTQFLTADTAGPRCHVKLCLTYAKGKNADNINDSLIRSGVLSPDFFSITDKRVSAPEAADSFVTKYMSDYKSFYGDLYKADRGNGASYNCEYILNSKISQDNPDYYTYEADVYNYMGGAHGSSITIIRNISVKDGKIVTLKSLFVPGFEKGLQEAIVKSLCEKNGVNDINALSAKTTIFDGIDVYVSDNFIIGKKSMTFIYSPDEIACHAAGEIRVEVSKDDIKNLFKK